MADHSLDLVIAHWSHPIEDFRVSPLAFYAAVNAGLERRQIPDIVVSRVEWREAGALSARRTYLRVTRGDVAFDVCAAPFGTGFFFSWWLAWLPPSWWYLLAFVSMFAVLNLLVGTIAVQIVGYVHGLIFATAWAPLSLMLFAVAVRFGILRLEHVVLRTPIVGWLYAHILLPITYHRIDTTTMFRSMVHAAVQEVIDELTKAQGIRALSELERKPLLRGFREA